MKFDKIAMVANRAALKVKKHSPEILVVTGAVSVVTGTILACKATLKIDDILAEHEETVEKIETVLADDRDDYTEEDAKKDKVILTVKTGWKLVKLYAPAGSLVIGGIFCFCSAYGIMKRRNVALVAAYNTLDNAFKQYRQRVRDDAGEEKDFGYLHGTEIADKKLEKETAGEVKAGEKIFPEGVRPSMYARFFDERSREWVKNPEYNLMFLNQQQRMANDLLQVRGHVFLNEVYDMLGFQRTSAGAIVGWVKGVGDDYIDFGIYDIRNPDSRDFVNGYERSILLDFNVDGVIYDLI